MITKYRLALKGRACRVRSCGRRRSEPRQLVTARAISRHRYFHRKLSGSASRTAGARYAGGTGPILPVRYKPGSASLRKGAVGLHRRVPERGTPGLKRDGAATKAGGGAAGRGAQRQHPGREPGRGGRDTHTHTHTRPERDGAHGGRSAGRG